MNIIIEDFLPIDSETPLSKVTSLFLLNIAGDIDRCDKPRIVDPETCITAVVNQKMIMRVVAEPGEQSQ